MKIDPTMNYEKALALFSTLPKPKPFSLIDPKKDFRNYQGSPKSKMVSSVVDVQPKPKEPGQNPLIGLIYDNQAKTQEELARQQRRVAAQGMVNSLGNVVKSLFSSYGASKGAPISPIKSTSQFDIARMDQLWNQQMMMEQRANAEKLQLMLEDYRTGRADQQYRDRYDQSQEDEERRDSRNFDQQKTLFQLNEDKQKEAADLAFERNKVLYGVKSEAQQALADQKEAARLAELEKYGKFAPRSESSSMTPEEKLDYEAEKAKQKTYFSIGDTDLTEGQYNEILTNIEELKSDNAVPVVNKKGKQTGEVTYKDPRFKVLDDIDMSTKIGQDKAVRTYYKLLQEPAKAGASESTGQPATTTKAAPRKGMTIDDFGKSIDRMFNDKTFKALPRETKAVHLRTIFLSKQKEIPELNKLTQEQIDGYINEYMDTYFPEKVKK